MCSVRFAWSLRDKSPRNPSNDDTELWHHEVPRSRTAKVRCQDVWRPLPDGDEDRERWRSSISPRFPGLGREGEHHRSAQGEEDRNPTWYTIEDDTSVGGIRTIHTIRARRILSNSTVVRQDDQVRWLWTGRELNEGEILRATAPDDPRQSATDEHQDGEGWKADEWARLRSARLPVRWRKRDHEHGQILAPGIPRELRNSSRVWRNYDAITRNVDDPGDLETIDPDDSRQDDQELPRTIPSMVWRSREDDYFLPYHTRYDHTRYNRLHDRVRDRWEGRHDREDNDEMRNEHEVTLVDIQWWRCLFFQHKLHIELWRISVMKMEERRMDARYVHDCWRTITRPTGTYKRCRMMIWRIWYDWFLIHTSYGDVESSTIMRISMTVDQPRRPTTPIRTRTSKWRLWTRRKSRKFPSSWPRSRIVEKAC